MAVPVRPVRPSQAASNEWQTIGTEFTQRSASIAIWGPTSGGKTTLALSAKGPTALLHASEKIKGIVEPYVRNGKVVRALDFGFVASHDEKDTAIRARETWAKWDRLYTDAMKNWAGTIIVDTEPDAYALRRLAKFGTLQPQGDTRDLYASVNFDWRQIFKNKPREQAEKRGVNLITIHTASDEYHDVMKKNNQGVMKKVSEKTGRFKMDGHKEVKYWADVILWAEMDINGLRHVRIDKPWWNGTLTGMDLTEELMVNMGYEASPVHNTALTIPNIMAVITETAAKEWE